MKCDQVGCLSGNCVLGEGNVNGTMYIGEAPGATEEQTERSFIGLAGQFLRQGVGKKVAYFTNAVKCRPPNNRRPKKKEINYCWERWLDKEIKVVRPKKIVCLGKTAAISLGLMGSSDKVKDYIHKEFFYQGIPVTITYHPSHARRFGKTLDL